MNRFFPTLAASTIVFASPLAPGREPPPPSPSPAPNIVLVLVDDLGFSDLACCGSTYYETPNIDRLAAAGIRFINGYAACAVCSPTRAAVMTGRYPARLGLTDWIRASFQGTKIPEDRKNPTEYIGSPKRPLLCPPNPYWMELEERTIAEILNDAGYTTCHIGKWHLGFDDWYPEKQGFDVNIGGCDYGHPPSYFDPYCNKNHCIPTIEPRKEGEYLTDREADEAVRFIADHAEELFFLYWAPYAVHTPIQAREDLIEKYRAKPKTNHKNPAYAAMIESVDHGVGRILHTLDRLNLTDNTLIIFTSDNGGLLGPTDNAPLRAGKGSPYEGGIRVPFIVRWPGITKPGATCDEPVCSIDLLPTLCEAARLAQPQDRPIDGRSLLPLLRGHLPHQDGPFLRNVLLWHFPHYRYNQVGPYSIIRAGDWKLIKFYDTGVIELYNLKTDPGEMHDLSAQMPEKTQQCHDLLEQWLRNVEARLPRPNPHYSQPDPAD